MEILIIALGCLLIFNVQLKIYRKKCFENLDYCCYFSTSETHEGNEIEFIEEIKNHKSLSLPVFKSELTASANLYFADTNSAITDGSRFVSSFFEIKGESKIKRIWKLKCTKRGVYGIDNVVLVTTDIFGAETFSYRPKCVLPKIIVLPSSYSFDVKKIIKTGFSGDISLRNPPFSDPFFSNGIREYTGAEPLRFINHNASASQSTLMVNTFESSAESKISLIIDFNCTEKIAEHSIRVCTFFLRTLEKYGIKTELYLTSDPIVHIPYGNGGVHLKKCLYALANADVTKFLPLNKVLKGNLHNTFLITADKNTAHLSGLMTIFTGYLCSNNNRIINVPERSDGDEKS